MQVVIFFLLMPSIFVSVILFISSLIYSYIERYKHKKNKRIYCFRLSCIFYVLSVLLFYSASGGQLTSNYFLLALVLMTPALFAYTLLNFFLNYVYLRTEQKKIAHRKPRNYKKPTSFNSAKMHTNDCDDSVITFVNPASGLPMINESFDMNGNPLGFDNSFNDDSYRIDNSFSDDPFH